MKLSEQKVDWLFQQPFSGLCLVQIIGNFHCENERVQLFNGDSFALAEFFHFMETSSKTLCWNHSYRYVFCFSLHCSFSHWWSKWGMWCSLAFQLTSSDISVSLITSLHRLDYSCNSWISWSSWKRYLFYDSSKINLFFGATIVRIDRQNEQL